MKRRNIILLLMMAVLLFTASFLVYSQSNSEESEYITQAEFINIIITILKLEDRLPSAPTLPDKAELLGEIGYSPLDGWILDKILTKGDAAVVLVRLLDFPEPQNVDAGAYIQLLVNRGIFDPSVKPGDIDLPFSWLDLAASITMASLGNLASEYLQPYKLPISPVKTP